MNKRQAHIEALRCIVELVQAQVADGYEPTGHTKDDEKIRAAILLICKEMGARADVLEAPAGGE